MAISNACVPLAVPQRPAATDQQAVDIELVAQGEARRAEIERFIHIVFKRAFGARVSHFLPYLLSMRQNGKLLAALGIRPAAERPLFLENYLDKPVENTLAERVARPLERGRIVEVGNLASVCGGGARALIITLTAYLKGAGYEWVVFTATPQVRNHFAKLGIELIPLVPADKACLGEAQRDWGTYYERGPVVVAGGVDQGAKALAGSLGEHCLFPTARQLWDDAHRAGRLGHLWQPPRTLAASWPEWMLDSVRGDHDDFGL